MPPLPLRALPAAAMLALAAGAPATAQSVRFERPDAWRVRADHPDADVSDGLELLDLPPGFQVTTGPAVILWHPDRTAQGSFRAELEVYLFDPGTRREEFGLFVGGSDLDGPGQAYVSVLIREGGEFTLRRRRGSAVHTLVDWTRHPSIVSWSDRPAGESSARNVLAVEADGDEVRFFINGREIVALPRASLPPVDGIAGVRVGEELNLHVARLEITRER